MYVDGNEMTSNVKLYLDHLRMHKDKDNEARCNRCSLKFVHLGKKDTLLSLF